MKLPRTATTETVIMKIEVKMVSMEKEAIFVATSSLVLFYDYFRILYYACEISTGNREALPFDNSGTSLGLSFVVLADSLKRKYRNEK